MALKPFQSKGGFSDGNITYLSGVGVPGGDAGAQDAAPVGSFYSNSTDGATYKKEVAGAGVGNWVKQANVTDLAGLSATQSWREPVVVRDAVNATTAAAIIEMDAADTLDGVTIAAGDRVLLSQVLGGAGPNVYIVGGVSGAWTLTEDVNLETAGDTLQVLSGTSANQIWFFDGTVWGMIGANSSAEDQFMRAFVGKAAAGGELPSYTSQNYVANSDSLETAIGKLDAQSALNASQAAAASGSSAAVQAELDATQTGAGLGANGAYTVQTASNYATTATSITGAISELDTNVAAAIAATDANVATNASGLAAQLGEINAVESGAGLAADGTYVPVTGSNYTNSSTSLANAISMLDTQAGAHASAVATNTADIAVNTAGVATNTADIATNAADIATNASGLAAEITARTSADSVLDGKIGSQAYSSTVHVASGSSSTVAIGALDAAIADLLKGNKLVGISAGVVDSILFDSAEVCKWIVSVTEVSTGIKYSAEIMGSHNGTVIADATVVDYNDYGELEIGGAIAGFSLSVVLNGVGTAQTMQLVHTSTNACDITVRRVYA